MQWYLLNVKGEAEPCTVEEWAAWRTTNPVHVHSDAIGEAHVSTVFLGMDHRLHGAGTPILFETLVFGGPLDGEGDRYSTSEEAEAGHCAICARVRDMAKLTGK